MIINSLRAIAISFALILTVSLTGSAFAQCNCGDCSAAAGSSLPSLPIGSDYTEFGNQSSGDCGCSDCDSGDCYGVNNRCNCDVFKKCRYFSVFGGWNGLQTFEQSSITANSVDANVGSFDEGWIAGVAVGAQVHARVRYEIEATYRENNADAFEIQDIVDNVVIASLVEPATGDIAATSGMINLLFDLNPRQVDCWNIYAGGGIGLTRVEGTITAVTDTFEVNDTSLALQAILGTNKAISKRMDLYSEYRYFQANNINVQNTAGSLGDFTYATNSVLFGIRFRR